MAKQVCSLAMLKCDKGVAPGTFMVTPEKMVNTSSQSAANIMDHIPMKNIMPFGMCTSSSNPAVAAAQGAPVPCIPVTTSPWSPGAKTVEIKGQPALNDTSTLKCMMGGTIEVTNPGQTTHDIP